MTRQPLKSSRFGRAERWAAAGGLGLLVVSASVAWLATSAAPTGQPVASVATSLPAACRLVPGDALAFEVTSRSATIVDLKVLGAGGPAPRLSRHALSSRMRWQVLAQEASGWRVSSVLSEVRFEAGADAVDPVLLKALAEPFEFRMAQDCRFVAFGFAAATPARARSSLIALLKGAEFILSSPASASWSAAHEDATGAYEAEYRRAPGDGARVHKRRVAYSSVRPPAPGVPAGLVKAIVHASAVDIALRRDGRWAQRLLGDEHVELLVGASRLADVKTQLEVRAVEPGPSSPPPALATSQLLWQGAAPDARGARTPLAIPEGPAGGPAASLGDAMAGFRARLDLGRPEALSSAVIFLAQHLRAHPADAAAVLESIRAGSAPDREQSILFHVLEVTGTHESESALLRALEDPRLASRSRMRAAAALSGAPTASTAAADALLRVASESDGPRHQESFEVSSAALLALGALGQKAGEGEASLASRIRSELLGRLATEAGPEWKAVTIDALANLKDPTTLDALAAASLDTNPTTRLHVASALGELPGLPADALVRTWLHRESDERVRAALYDAAARWENVYLPSLSLQETVVARLPLEPAPSVRASAIRALGPAASVAPGPARAGLTRRFREEKVPGLLVLIGRYLDAEALR
jgi:hypothetical protein